MLRKRAAWAVLLLIAVPVSIAHASTKDDLEATKKELAESKERQKTLASEERRLQKELEEIREKLVEAVAAIQDVDRDLYDTKQKLDIIAEQADSKKKSIEKNKARLDGLVQVALRFSKMPMEAMVVMPGDARQRLRVSRALKMISQDIRQETDALNRQIQELKDLEQKIRAYHQEITVKRDQLAADRKALAQDVEVRRQIQQKLLNEQRKEAAKAAALAEKASGLNELIETLKKQRESKRLEAEQESSGGWFTETASKGKVRSFIKTKGRLKLPVPGEVRERFGDVKKSGSPSKGLSIATSASSEVVAPYDGEVIYSGQFLTYGQMVIIKHSDDFHTLLAGLGNIDVNPGEFLLEGEPIGDMGRKGNDPRLYLELRKNNQPVDPTSWFIGLKGQND